MKRKAEWVKWVRPIGIPRAGMTKSLQRWFGLGQQPRLRFQQPRQFRFHHVPDQLVFRSRMPENDYVTECDDARDVGNLYPNRRAGLSLLRKCLVDNFKLTLDREAHHLVGQIVVKCAISGEADNFLGGVPSIP